MMVMLSVHGALQDKFVSYLLCVKFWLSWNLKITTNLNLDIERSDLSTDQMYLYEICWLVSSGIVPGSVAKRYHGNMSHTRWLTTANKLLRLYVATESRDENLLSLVNIILKIYAEMWFRKKCIQQVQNGVVNLFLLLKAMLDLDDSRILFVVRIAYPFFQSRKKINFFWLWTSRYCAIVLKFCNNVLNSAYLWISPNAVSGSIWYNL